MRMKFLRKTAVAGFTLIELLIVLSILSMMAGVVLPSASVMMQKNRLESFIHRSSILCREAFERAVFSGRQYMVSHEMGHGLTVSYFENSRWNPVTDVWLKSVDIPVDCEVDWPQNGWIVLPEGFCESPRLRFHDSLSKDTVFIKIRAYDAQFTRELPTGGKL